MRVLQCYRFRVGTKIPFDKWPALVDQFLREQNLTHSSFHYYLEDYDASNRCRSVLDGSRCKNCCAFSERCPQCRKEAESTLRRGSACQQAVRENPFLGQIQVRTTQYSTIHSVHNFDDFSNISKENIYSILSKLYRRYGFTETALIYRDINFFSHRVPSPKPDPEHLLSGYSGSGITLYRDCNGKDNAIMLVAESLYPGDIPDATPYADALGVLLPGIKRISGTDVLMDAAEQLGYEQLHSQAEPLIAKANAFFCSHMPEEKGNNLPAEQVSTAFWLKKLSKRYGYSYLGFTYYLYFLEKKLPNGHYICLEFMSNPLSPDADPFVNLCGLGFHHQIWIDGFSPQNAQDAAAYFTCLFETLSEAERTVFPPILDLYPPTPDWFMPTH